MKKFKKADDACRWFLMCTNKAEHMEPHPILGQVPICTSCKEKMDRLKR